VAELNHGPDRTYSTHGCRCEPCKKAHARRNKFGKKRRLSARVIRNGDWFHPAAPHGTYNGYSNYGCRCQACRMESSSYEAARWEANR
jgi:hypothetical protein